MLDPWFRRAYPRKHQAKQLSWWLAEGPLLHGARSVLFTSEGERRCAEEAFWPYRFPFNVSGYGTADPPPPSAEQETAWLACLPELRGRAFVLFLGRIHVKKGCDMLLRAFAKVAAQQLDTDLVIAGPDGDGSAASLRALAEQLGIERRVHWPGMLQEGAKWGALHGCLAFALPSHGENFGVAVAEAMACAKPVLVSERVNIAPEIAGEAAGLVRPDTVAGTTALLKTLFELTPAERDAMGQRARRCFLRSFLIDQLAEEVLSILSGQTLPERASHLAAAATEAGFVPRAFSQQEA
jgi:glycosyltransferase involved in cell wall biosynthesis